MKKKIQKKFSWTQIRVLDRIYSHTSLQRVDSSMSGKMRSRQASNYGEPKNFRRLGRSTGSGGGSAKRVRSRVNDIDISPCIE